MENAAAQVGPWLPTLRVLTKELEKYPDVELVDVRGADEHVRVATHHGRLLIDVDAPGETVHVACPFVMIRDVANALEADAPAA